MRKLILKLIGIALVVLLASLLGTHQTLAAAHSGGILTVDSTGAAQQKP